MTAIGPLPVDTQNPAAGGDPHARPFLEALFAAYEDECVRYVVLRNYECWPDNFGKDIDLVLNPNDLQLSHAIIRRLAEAHGLAWMASRRRSSHINYYLAPLRCDGVARGLVLDVRTDVVHNAFVYLPGALVLESRRRHAEGGLSAPFYVPSPALESLAVLLHCVFDKGAVRPSYRARLRELDAGESEEFRHAATAVVGRTLAAELAECLAAGTPERALGLRRRLLLATARRNPEAISRWLRGRRGAVWDRVMAWVRLKGHVVILAGPDGSGKTTLAELICRRFAPTRIPASAVYLGAQKPLLPTRRLSQKIRGRLASPGTPRPLKDVDRRERLRGLLHILADKWLRYLVHVRPRLVRGEVVVLDRYFYDLRTFPHPLVQRPWLEAVIMRLIPKPALAFCLTADPELIAARKRELTVAETARQLECFRGLRRWIRNFHEVPADGDLKAVVDGMTKQILRLYARDRSPQDI